LRQAPGTTSKMSKRWSAIVGALHPYVPGEQPAATDVIKLNTNENPYGPSPRALAAIREETSASLRLYPDPEATVLKSALAEYHAITPRQVFVGNGSDEVLAHIFHGLLKQPDPVLFPEITYSFYPVYCALYEIAFATIPLTGDFEIDLDDYARKNGGVIFANPNAPTGIGLPRDAIETLLQRNTGSVVVVDEAYVAFGGGSVVDLIDRYDNLLVVQTLSKSHALAGLRVGFAFGDPSLVDALDRVKNSFNSYPLDRLAIVGAVAAITDRDYFETTRRQVIATRERLVADLRHLDFAVLPSQTNFVFTSHPSHAAADLAHALRQRSIVVRHFSQNKIANYLRITVGTDGQVAALIGALTEILEVV
jgi:histidinol-phosphate aminotransferase